MRAHGDFRERIDVYKRQIELELAGFRHVDGHRARCGFARGHHRERVQRAQRALADFHVGNAAKAAVDDLHGEIHRARAADALHFRLLSLIHI